MTAAGDDDVGLLPERGDVLKELLFPRLLRIRMNNDCLRRQDEDNDD